MRGKGLEGYAHGVVKGTPQGPLLKGPLREGLVLRAIESNSKL